MSRLPLVLLLTVFTTQAWSATLRVERDGSTPYTTIQPAIDAAAPGDTILIGPGRYIEHQTVTLTGWSWTIEVYAMVRTDSLTIMGADRDAVVIGPDTASFYRFGPMGIVFEHVAGANVRSLTAINTYSGVYALTRGTGATVIGSLFRGCSDGIAGFCEGALLVSDCVFEECDGSGISCANPTPRFELSRSTFSNNAYAVFAIAVPSVLIEHCQIARGSVGIQFEQGTAGEVRNCQIKDVLYAGISAPLGGIISMRSVTISGGVWNVKMSGGQVTGSDCEFSGASGATISCPDWPTFTLHNCHILGGGGWLVQLARSNELPVIHADLRNNYWGIADQDSIAALIWDGNDDPTINGIVDFEPFSPTPLPTEKKSLGGVKRLFR